MSDLPPVDPTIDPTSDAASDAAPGPTTQLAADLTSDAAPAVAPESRRGLGALARTGFTRFETLLFSPQSVASMALYRIAVGVLLLLWTATLALDLQPFYASDGLNRSTVQGWSWSLLEISDSPAVITTIWALLLLVSVAVMVGWHTRISVVAMFVLLMSLQRRDPWILNSGDLLVRHLVVYLMLMPSGLALSLDARRRGVDTSVAWPQAPQWPMYLLRVQMAAIYLFTVLAKLPGDTWNEGTAVAYALRLIDHQRFRVPWAITDVEVIANLLTYGTLMGETALALLVWNRKLRPWVLLVGLALHVGIDLTITVGFFSYAIVIGYLGWCPPAWSESFVAWLRAKRAGDRPTRQPAPAGA